MFSSAATGAPLSKPRWRRPPPRRPQRDRSRNAVAFSRLGARKTGFSSHEIELSLAHAAGDTVEKAYRRGDMSTTGATSWRHGRVIA